MKVKTIGNSPRPAAVVPLPDDWKRTSATERSFQHSFHQQSGAQYEKYVAELTKKIDEQGALLKKRADIAELQRYREYVGELIAMVAGNAYKYNKENVFDMRGRRKVYSTVDKINEKLEELAQEILREQQDSLAILHAVDDIRGLIVDLLS